MTIHVESIASHALPRVTADHLEAAARRALDERGVAHLGLSGGRTPWAAFQAFGLRRLPWQRVHLWQVDERVAPDGDPARNAVGIERSFDRLGTPLHLMPVVPPEPDVYRRQLDDACGGVLDLVHLGLGPDGHTASWPPGDPVIEVDDVDVAMSDEYEGHVRMTLTVPAVNRARGRLFLVTGDDKASALAALITGTPDIPAQQVTDEATTVLTDLDIDGVGQ